MPLPAAWLSTLPFFFFFFLPPLPLETFAFTAYCRKQLQARAKRKCFGDSTARTERKRSVLMEKSCQCLTAEVRRHAHSFTNTPPLPWMRPEMLSSPPAAGLLARHSSFGHRQPALSSEGCCFCMSSAEVPLWLSYRFCLSSWACRLLAGRLASFLPSLLIPQPLHDCCILR